MTIMSVSILNFRLGSLTTYQWLHATVHVTILIQIFSLGVYLSINFEHLIQPNDANLLTKSPIVSLYSYRLQHSANTSKLLKCIFARSASGTSWPQQYTNIRALLEAYWYAHIYNSRFPGRYGLIWSWSLCLLENAEYSSVFLFISLHLSIKFYFNPNVDKQKSISNV